jgi:hypothetical protein
MSYVPGTASATSLVRVGLPHEVVVKALVTELDLTREEAEAAWQVARLDELAEIRRVMDSIAQSTTLRSVT